MNDSKFVLSLLDAIIEELTALENKFFQQICDCSNGPGQTSMMHAFWYYKEKLGRAKQGAEAIKQKLTEDDPPN